MWINSIMSLHVQLNTVVFCLVRQIAGIRISLQPAVTRARRIQRFHLALACRRGVPDGHLDCNHCCPYCTSGWWALLKATLCCLFSLETVPFNVAHHPSTAGNPTSQRTPHSWETFQDPLFRWWPIACVTMTDLKATPLTIHKGDRLVKISPLIVSNF